MSVSYTIDICRTQYFEWCQYSPTIPYKIKMILGPVYYICLYINAHLFPLNLVHTCTTINLQKACKSSMTFSPSNHYTPFHSFLLFLSNSFAIRIFTLSLSLSLYLSFHPSSFYFLQSWIQDCNIKNVPYSAS